MWWIPLIVTTSRQGQNSDCLTISVFYCSMNWANFVFPGRAPHRHLADCEQRRRGRQQRACALSKESPFRKVRFGRERTSPQDGLFLENAAWWWSELMGSLKLGNVWAFLQLIFGPRCLWISWTKTQTLPNLRLPISSDDDVDEKCITVESASCGAIGVAWGNLTESTVETGHKVPFCPPENQPYRRIYFITDQNVHSSNGYLP